MYMEVCLGNLNIYNLYSTDVLYFFDVCDKNFEARLSHIAGCNAQHKTHITQQYIKFEMYAIMPWELSIFMQSIQTLIRVLRSF